MTEINAAWAVLRSPSARARYDDELVEVTRESDLGESVTSSVIFDNLGFAPGKGFAPGSEFPGGVGGPAPVGPRPRLVSLEPDDIADLALIDDSMESTRKSRWALWAPVIVGGSVLVVAIVIGVAKAPHPSTSTVKLQTAEQFSSDTCVAVITDPSSVSAITGSQASPAILSVPCTAPHNGRVTSVEDAPKPCPVGAKAFRHPTDANRSVCVIAE